VSGLILSNRNFFNSPRNFYWLRASLCEFRLEREELKFIATPIYIGISKFIGQATCLLRFHWRHFMNIQTFLFTDICHKMCKYSYDFSISKITSLERQCTISLYLSLKR